MKTRNIGRIKEMEKQTMFGIVDRVENGKVYTVEKAFEEVKEILAN